MPKRRAAVVGAPKLKPHRDPASGLFQTALKQHQAGKFDQAELLYRNIIAQNPKHAFALSNLGVLLRRQRKLSEAIALYRRAIQADPNIASSHNNLGNALTDRGMNAAAQGAFRNALRLRPDYAEATVGLARVLDLEGEPQRAVEVLRELLQREPRQLMALELIGQILVKLRENEAALPYLKRTLELDPSHAGALNNIGCVHSDRGNKLEALNYFRRAAEANPASAPCHVNLGNALQELEGARAAIPHFKRAIDVNPKYAKGWFNLAGALSHTDQKAQVECLRRVLALDKHHLGAIVNSLLLAERTCNFTAAEGLHRSLELALESRVEETEDWGVLGSVAYSAPFRPVRRELLERVHHRIDYLLTGLAQRQDPLESLSPRNASSPKEKLRIGYVSPNFRNHPVGHVTLPLVRAHDRLRFEVHGFSTSDAQLDSDPYFVSHRQGFDFFHAIGKHSARDAASLIRNTGIDILIDLDGYLDKKSPPILAFRPAPVQLYWLGHTGGLGLSYVDYLLADAVVIPPGEERLHRESVVRLPDLYHCADRPEVSTDLPSRAELGLPDSGVVFCASSIPQKIDRSVFECWLRILDQVEDSCLWFSFPNGHSDARTNLEREAREFDIDPKRLVFSPSTADRSVQLARYRHADLFLDTLTFSASATALDALWSGVPILTVAGSEFASRIASTMLHALGLSELIANDIPAYEALAVEFALNPGRLAEVRQRVIQARLSQPLFDIQRFARSLEQAFEQMWEKHSRGEPPHGFDLSAAMISRR